MKKLFLSLILLPILCFSQNAYMDMRNMTSIEYFKSKGVTESEIDAFCESRKEVPLAPEFCAEHNLEVSQKDLAATYKRSITKAKSLDIFKKTHAKRTSLADLIEAQKRWNAYSKANCQFQYTLIGDGSSRTVAYYYCLASMTKNRDMELTDMLSWIAD